MKNVLVLATNDLRLFFRDRSAWVWLVLIPLGFIGAMGSLRFGGGGAPMNFNVAVVIDNRDTGVLGRMVGDELRKQGLWVVEPADERAKFTIRVPADFSSRLAAKEKSNLVIAPIGEPDDAGQRVVELKALRAVIDLNALIVRAVMDHGPSALSDEAKLQAVATQPAAVTVAAKYAGRRPVPSGFNQSLPGTLVMYLVMNLLIFGGTRLAMEREAGVLRRIAIHPLRPYQLVAGRILGLLFLACVPIAVLLAVGGIAFHVPLLAQLHWIVLTLLLVAWVAASLGVLIGYTVKAREKIIGLALLVSLPAAALGGCWWPMEIVPEWARPVCYSFPTAWAMDALHQFITFGGGFAAAAPALGIVALFGLAANLAAMKFFRV